MTCKNCDINFPAKDPIHGNIRKAFCSHACYRNWHRGANHQDYEGGRWLEKSKGYWMLSLGNGKHRAEHVILAEKALGRNLRPNECVHHIDGNKTNNTSGNLLICTREYHSWLHARMSYLYQQEHFAAQPAAVEVSGAKDVMPGG